MRHAPADNSLTLVPGIIKTGRFSLVKGLPAISGQIVHTKGFKEAGFHSV
jgi:hypothetical protein